MEGRGGGVIDQQTMMLATIGDLELTRRQLLMEIEARDKRIKELKEADDGRNPEDRHEDHV